MFGFRLALLACVIIPVQAASLSVLANFTPNPNGYSAGQMVQGADGYLYGISNGGGAYNGGAFFQITSAGQLTTLFSFNSSNGHNPGSLIPGPPGIFYGVASSGGTNNYGTVFKITSAGVLTTLHSFTGSDGESPSSVILGGDGFLYTVVNVENATGGARILKISTITGAVTIINPGIGFDAGLSLYFQGIDGNFYGVFYDPSGSRSIVQVSTSGQITIIYSFGGYEAPDLIPGPNGTIYGSTVVQGANHLGTIFQLTTSGVMTTLVTFSSSSATNIPLHILLGQDGNFYGTAQGPGSDNPLQETVFQANPSGAVTTLATGSSLYGLVQVANGDFYFETSGGGGGTIKRMSNGTITTLYDFSSSNLGGPTGTLIQATDGNLYGTAGLNGKFGWGGAFKLTPLGAVTTLASFTQLSRPLGLCQGQDGNFYGVTQLGPTSNGEGFFFQLKPDGTLTTLYAFSTSTGSPNSALIMGNDENFYGATNSIIYKITPTGTFTTLATFTSAYTGINPATLVQGKDGNFYGTTAGGLNSAPGTFFRVTPLGQLTLLATFAQGMGSPAAMVLGSDGNFYGATSGGGNSNSGIIFQATPTGSLATIAAIPAGIGSSVTGFVMGNDGNFYGATRLGGIYGNGTIFQATVSGSMTSLLSFTLPNGSTQAAPNFLMQANDGTLYGTTFQGGADNDGVIFNVSTGATTETFTGASNVPITTSSSAVAGITLTLNLNFAPTLGMVLTLINNTGTSPIGGNYANLPNGGTITANYAGHTYTFTSNYSGGDGNDLTLTTTAISPPPETPATDSPTMPTWGLVMLGVLLSYFAVRYETNSERLRRS